MKSMPALPLPFVLAGRGGPPAVPVKVHAAASLKECLTEIAATGSR